MIIKYALEDRIREAQKQCPEIHEIQELMKEGKAIDYRVDEQGTLWLKTAYAYQRMSRSGERF